MRPTVTLPPSSKDVIGATASSHSRPTTTSHTLACSWGSTADRMVIVGASGIDDGEIVKVANSYRLMLYWYFSTCLITFLGYA
jgi:hypothetical protein